MGRECAYAQSECKRTEGMSPSAVQQRHGPPLAACSGTCGQTHRFCLHVQPPAVSPAMGRFKRQLLPMSDAVPSPAQVVTCVSKVPTQKINTLRVDWSLFRIQLRENESQISYSTSPGE